MTEPIDELLEWLHTFDELQFSCNHRNVIEKIWQIKSKQQFAIHSVVNCKTQQKIAVVGCGDAGITVARRLAEKGFDAVAIHDFNSTPLTLKDYAKPKEIEPLILKQTIPDDYFNKPQNRADRRKQEKAKRKKRKR